MNCTNCGMKNNSQALHCMRCNVVLSVTQASQHTETYANILTPRRAHVDTSDRSNDHVDTSLNAPLRHRRRKTQLEGVTPLLSSGSESMTEPQTHTYPVSSSNSDTPLQTVTHDQSMPTRRHTRLHPISHFSRDTTLPHQDKSGLLQDSRRLIGWLVTFDFNRSGQVYLIREGKTTIGRGPQNDHSMFFDNTISDHHATIIYRKGQLAIKDEGSTSGVYVNHEDIGIGEVEKLKNHDIITIGQMNFVIYLIELDHYETIWNLSQ